MTKYWLSAEKSVEITGAPEANAVCFNVDGKDVAVSAGQTIFEALQRMPGIGEIPALCYSHAVRPYGACRLCTVEISEDGGKSFRFVACCLYEVKEGQVVKTGTAKL